MHQYLEKFLETRRFVDHLNVEDEGNERRGMACEAVSQRVEVTREESELREEDMS